MLATDGNTATYMQYAYARCRGIFRKGEVDEAAVPHRSRRRWSSTHAAGAALALQLLRFPEAVEAAAADYLPHLITGTCGTWRRLQRVLRELPGAEGRDAGAEGQPPAAGRSGRPRHQAGARPARHPDRRADVECRVGRRLQPPCRNAAMALVASSWHSPLDSTLRENHVRRSRGTVREGRGRRPRGRVVPAGEVRPQGRAGRRRRRRRRVGHRPRRPERRQPRRPHHEEALEGQERRGRHGPRSAPGKNAEDIVLLVPPGTIVRDRDRGNVLKDLVANRRRGGRGEGRQGRSRERPLQERDQPRPAAVRAGRGRRGALDLASN